MDEIDNEIVEWDEEPSNDDFQFWAIPDKERVQLLENLYEDKKEIQPISIEALEKGLLDMNLQESKVF